MFNINFSQLDPLSITDTVNSSVFHEKNTSPLFRKRFTANCYTSKSLKKQTSISSMPSRYDTRYFYK